MEVAWVEIERLEDGQDGIRGGVLVFRRKC